MTMAGIPKSELTLKIPTTDLYALPPDASFHGKKGQANVDVKTQGDTLIVYASCDSLQRIVEWYASELTRILLEKANILIKDCSSKCAFSGKQYVRIAIRNQQDNDKLATALITLSL